MKKRICSLLLAIAAIGVLGGCGSKEEEKSLKDMNVDKYVTIGEYKGLEISLSPVSVDETELNTLIDNMYNGHVTAENGGVTDRAVAVGDTVNLDYEGKKDGVAFAGGTAQGYNLTIGSGQFIDGFEDGLVGVMPGETVDLELTFPAQYHSAELAGQAVVFTATVNYIMPTEKEDSVIAAMGIENVSNEQELRQYAYDYLAENAERTYQNNARKLVLESFMNNCTFEEVPAQMVEKYEQNTRENIEANAASFGVDADTFTNYYYQKDFETFVKEYAQEAARQDVALQAVANKENLNISDEELDSMLLENAQTAGYETVEEYLGEVDREDYREYFMYEKVLDYLVENAAISNK